MAYGDKSNSIEIVFDTARCIHTRSVWTDCSLCRSSCPSGCIQLQDRQRIPSLDTEKCINCGTCLSSCPLDAFSSPHFSERTLLSRIEPDQPIRLRCFAPYSETAALVDANEYQLGTCLAALTPGGLFELAFSRSCTLVTSRCEGCSLFARVEATMRSNIEMASALLADWERESNLAEDAPYFLPEYDLGVEVCPDTTAFVPPGFALSGQRNVHAPDTDSFDGSAAESSAEAGSSTGTSGAQANADSFALSDNIKSSIRALFQGARAKRISENRESRDSRLELGGIKLQVKRRHVPVWRVRLETFWRSHGPSVGVCYPWPKHYVSAHACKACGVCMQLCPTGSIRQRLQDGVFSYVHVPGTCTNCGLCVASCSAQAVSHGTQNLVQPFDEQEVLAWRAHACSKCGLPAREGTGDLCALCQAQPNEDFTQGRIKQQMASWLHEDKVN